MYIRISLPSDIEADSYIVTDNGKKLKVRSIYVRPIFPKPTSIRNVIAIEAVDRFKEISHKALVRIDGGKGKLQFLTKTLVGTTTTDYERKKYPRNDSLKVNESYLYPHERDDVKKVARYTRMEKRKKVKKVKKDGESNA